MSESESEELIYAESPKVEKKKKTKVKIAKGEDSDSEDNGNEEDKLGSSPLSEGNFKINNKKLLLTYKTHLNKKRFAKWINKLNEVEEVFIAHENGDEINPYEHSHVYVHFASQLVSSDPRVLDYDNKEETIHPHIKRVGKKNEDMVKVWYYITKEDKSEDLVELRKKADSMNGKKGVKSGLTNEDYVEAIWKCKNYQEALKKFLYGDPKNAPGIRAIWESKIIEERPKIMFRDIAEFTWQKTVLEMFLKPEWNHRLLRWVIDRLGGSGKTEFANYMVNTYNALYMSDITSGRDIATLVDEHLSCGGSAKYIIIDLSRAAKFHKIWGTLECLLNGKLTVMKWKGKSLHFDKPRLIVFSNFGPPVANEAGELPADQCAQGDVMSADRWDIYDMVYLKAEQSADGEHDRIIVQRDNPARNKNWVKSKRFANLDY